MGALPPAEHFSLYYNTAGPSLKIDLDILEVSLESASVLDVGCGPGGVLKYLKDQGCRVEGYDLDPHVVEYGKALIPEIFVGDALDFPSKIQEFDLVLLGCVLPHLQDPVNFLRRLGKKMNSHQKLILSLPNLDYCFEYSKQSFTDFLHLGHLFYFGFTTLERCVNEAGFTIEGSSPRGSAMVVVLKKSKKRIENRNNAFFATVSAINFMTIRLSGVGETMRKAQAKFDRSPVQVMRRVGRKMRKGMTKISLR